MPDGETRRLTFVVVAQTVLQTIPGRCEGDPHHVSPKINSAKGSEAMFDDHLLRVRALIKIDDSSLPRDLIPKFRYSTPRSDSWSDSCSTASANAVNAHEDTFGNIPHSRIVIHSSRNERIHLRVDRLPRDIFWSHVVSNPAIMDKEGDKG